MARRYQIDELLRLRASPLVTKPDKLPPIEQWMGPIPDPATQRKPNNSRDHTNNQNETTPNRRPSLFETRHVSRGSNSEDIILGPPKTSFASASRLFGKSSIDSTDRSKTNDSDDAKNDRYNFREKFFKDREIGDKDLDRRDTRLGTANGRRGGRDDRDDWGNGRPRRAFDQDEQDRRPRRTGDSDRWNNRDRDQQDLSYDRGNRDKEGRYTPRRDGQGRGRHEQSWFRDDNTQDAPDTEEERPSVRSKDWRRDRHGADRDWNRGARFEQDPEWLDSTDRDEPRPAHTQEDFQRWKERMKAGSAQPAAEVKKETPPEQASRNIQKPESRPTEGEMFSNLSTPFQMDSGLDKFFGLLGDNKAAQGTSTPASMDSTTKKDPVSTKPAKSSRFAGLFSPPAEAGKDSAAKPQLDRPVSTDADQEGFQRILQMLGGGKSRNTTPQVDSSQQPHPPPLSQAEQSRPETTLSSPARESVGRPDYMTYQDNAARNKAPPPGLEALLSPNAQGEAQAQQNRDRENLLRLMQQVKVSSPVTSQPPGNPQLQSAGPTPPGVLNVPDLLSRAQGMQKPQQKTPSFLDDPAIANMQRPDVDRRPTNGPPMGYFDDVPFPNAPQGNQGPNTPTGGRMPGQPPMVLQRPPGFEQMPPPGWAGHQLPPQQGGGPGPLAPPPGIPNPSRGMNPNFLSGPMPMHGSMPPPNDRQPFPRGTTGNGSASFGPPPGMMPPQGYMNMNRPPPSAFPMMPHPPDSLMGLPHAGQGQFGGGNAGPPGPPPSSRHLLEMFGQANGGDGRGGMVGPGHFR
ncbi:hypothetical protein VTN00DRAFT_9943 [Thermoascus crustaceus]|uniref:uncharacterized protein n=1 Tax=Thermoascus crustaceus TaxID=5088 RepID=UPI00374394B3